MSLETTHKIQKGPIFCNLAEFAMSQMFVNLIELASGKSIEDFLSNRKILMDESTFIDIIDPAML